MPYRRGALVKAQYESRGETCAAPGCRRKARHLYYHRIALNTTPMDCIEAVACSDDCGAAALDRQWEAWEPPTVLTTTMNDHGIMQAELAEALGATQQAVSESCRRGLHTTTAARRYADALRSLGADVGWRDLLD